MTTIRPSDAQVSQLVDLLTVVAAAPATSDEDRYQLHYSRGQVRELMPPIEVLVLAGVLGEGPERRRGSACLARLLSVASAATITAISQGLPSSSTEVGRPALRLAS